MAMRDLLAVLLLLVSAVASAPSRCQDASRRARPPPPCFRAPRCATRGRPGTVAVAAHPRDAATPFYQRLGAPTRVLAPMVAHSDLPFRLMCEQLYDVDLSYTQMIQAHHFAEPNEEFRTSNLDVYPQSTVRDVLLGREDPRALLRTPSQVHALQGLSDDEIERARQRILAAIADRRGADVCDEAMVEAKPAIVQIAAHDPDAAVAAARLILELSGGAAGAPVAAIDLNLGCPQSVANKGQYGSFLHDDFPELAYSVLEKLRAELPREVGVTAKMRLPPTEAQAAAGKLGTAGRPQTIDERVRNLIDCGVDLIAVHGRTRFENKVAVRAADWSAVRQCVESARSHSGDEHFPVISNGGIESAGDVRRCLATTHASGVMASEGMLEDPGLFAAGAGGDAVASAGGALARQFGHASAYLDYAAVLPPLPGALGTRGGSFSVVRGHLVKFLHRYLEEHEDLRAWLGDQELTTIKEASELVRQLRSRYDDLDEEELRATRSGNDDSSWYRRHRRQPRGQPREKRRGRRGRQRGRR